MFKIIAFLFAVFVAVIAEPGVVAPVAYSSPVVAAGPLAYSAHFGYSAPVVASPYAAPLAARFAYSSPLTYTAKYTAGSVLV